MKDSDFKKEWTPEDFKLVKKAITRHFKNKWFDLHYGMEVYFKNYTHIDSVLGLAYTSTGVYACYGICNTEIYSNDNKSLKYEFIIVGHDGNVYAELWDKDENATHIKL